MNYLFNKSFEKNIIITDMISNKFNIVFDDDNDMANLYTKNAYYIVTPNIIMEHFTSTEDNIFTETNFFGPTICSSILFNCLIELDSYNYDNIIKLLKKTINKFDLNKHIYLDTEADWYNNFLKDNINKFSNDCYLMEMSIFIAITAKTIDELIENAYNFVSNISENSIKILSFINMSIIMFFSKKYLADNKSLYKPNKWINLLIDLYINNIIDNKITNKNHLSEKRKMLFMLIKYSESKYSNLDFPHEKIKNLDNCFVTKIENTEKFIPGMTADQCFLMSINIFYTVNTWLGIISHTALSYINVKHITLLSSWLYFSNNDIDMHNSFNNILNKIKDIDEFSNNISKFKTYN